MSNQDEKPPLTLKSLKEIVDRYLEMKPDRELTVYIPNNKGGIGGTPVTPVVYAGGGIDWDAGKFFIYPQVKMIERPPDFTESKYQEAVQRIKSLQMIAERFVAAIEAEDKKEIHFATRFAKSSLDAFKKHPIP